MKNNFLIVMILALMTSSFAFAGKKDDEFSMDVSRGDEAKALMLLSTEYKFDKNTGQKAFVLAVETNSTVLAKRLLLLGVDGDLHEALRI